MAAAGGRRKWVGLGALACALALCYEGATMLSRPGNIEDLAYIPGKNHLAVLAAL